MPTQKLTLTGKIGPNISMTALVFNNFSRFVFDPNLQLLSITSGDGTIKDVDVSAATTFTWTVSSGSYTLTIS